MDVEFQSRLNAAWAKFWDLWPLLGKRDANLHKRIRLLEATVAKTLLWCSETWYLTVKQKRKLRTLQRTMLRKIVLVRRGPDEEYVTWIRRATRQAEANAKESGATCWLSTALSNKWKWAGELSRMSLERWASRTTFWRDSKWWSFQPRGGSSYGARPMRARPGYIPRWENELNQFASLQGWTSWQDVAKNVKSWEAAEKDFVELFWR